MPQPRSTLVAGIGNIFQGDDAFGVEVARRLAMRDWPDNVRVVDFGIRAVDLAFEFLDGYDTTILVDATARGGVPGTLYLIEPDIDALLENSNGACVNSHALDPAKVISMANSMGAKFKRLLVLGCEPQILDRDADGQIGLSPPVEVAVSRAIEMIQSIIKEGN